MDEVGDRQAVGTGGLADEGEAGFLGGAVGFTLVDVAV